MTVVLADTEDGDLIFAADSAASHGDEIYTVATPKVFALGSYLFGYAGSYRIGQILRHYVELPEPPARDAERFLVREVVPILRDAVREQGAAGPGKAVLGERTALLIGFRGRVWCVGADLTVTPEGAYAAIGSGRLLAYAAFHALDAVGVAPGRRRLELVLQATAKHTASVRRPWRFVTLGRVSPDAGARRGRRL